MNIYLNMYVCIFYLRTATVCNYITKICTMYAFPFLAALREHVLHGDRGRACVQAYHVRRMNTRTPTIYVHGFIKTAT